MTTRTTLSALAMSLALLLVPAAMAQMPADYTDHQRITDAPGASRVLGIIEAFNESTPESIESAISTHFTGQFADMPIEEHVQMWQSMFRSRGTAEFVSIRTYDPPSDELVVILKFDATGEYGAFSFQVEQDEPHRLLGMMMSPARRPSFLAPEPVLTDAELAAAVDERIDVLVAAERFSGTIMIAKDGVPFYSRAEGLAERRFGAPIELDTRFNLGSMNKMFTAVAIAQLVERGKLSWTDTVGMHLSDYPNAQVRDEVEIRHLLSHTSGMGSHFTDEFMESSKASYREFGDYLPLFQDDPLAFEPGSDWAYSNAGFFVLGLIVEAASGQSYYDFVRDNIFIPAGMTNTDSFDMDIPVPNLAIGYTRESMGPIGDGQRWLDELGGWRENTFMHSIKGGPAGGGFSTAPDLLAFDRALRDGTLVSTETFELLSSPKPELSSPNYGYGFGAFTTPNGRRTGHNGGFPGINSDLTINLDTGYTIVVMSNMDSGASIIASFVQAKFDARE